MNKEEELNRTYKLGISAGLKRAAKYLRDISAKNFLAGKDGEARLLRNLGEVLKEMSEKECPDIHE